MIVTCNLEFCKWVCMQSMKWKVTSSKFVTGLQSTVNPEYHLLLTKRTCTFNILKCKGQKDTWTPIKFKK